MIRPLILCVTSASIALLLGAACIGLDDVDEIVLPPIYTPPGESDPPQEENPNQPPDARVEQPQSSYPGGTLITLDASGSTDPDGDPLTYEWGMSGKASVQGLMSRDEIPDIALDDSDSAAPTFTAPFVPSAVRYTFAVTVRDDHEQNDVAFAVLTVLASGPVADAGPDQTVTEGENVNLDGSASYHLFDLEITEYLWQQIPLPDVQVVSIDNAESVVASITAPDVGEDPVTFRFLLLVTGEILDGLMSSNDVMEVTVLPEGYIPPPIADAGEDQHNAAAGDLVTLDASGSEAPSGGALTYEWTQLPPSEPVIQLDLADPAHPTFTTPDVALRTIFNFELEVSDDLSMRSDTDTVIVAVAPAVIPPDPPIGGDTASCAEYVAYFNSLDCTTETRNEADTCSESISEFCTGEPEFNGCRINNTFCDENGNFVENVEACSLLLVCD